MQLYLIRHGQSANNALWDRAGSPLERSPDPELTELGHKQAQCLARFLANARPGDCQEESLLAGGAAQQSRLPNRVDSQNIGGFCLTHLYCSPMIRAIETGLYIARALDMSLSLWEDLHEVGGIFCQETESSPQMGLPGNDRTYLSARFPELVLPDGWGVGGWWNRPFEQREQRILRAQRFFRVLMSEHGGRDDRIAVVSHAGFCNYFLAVALDWPIRGKSGFQVNNAAITRLDIGEHVRVAYTNRVDFMPRSLIS
jgi:2,3-bisphosphoglycerate-dependent phosphoglycerate mutase